MVSLLGKELSEKQEQQFKALMILGLAVVGFYFFIYLPDQQRQELEVMIQADITKTSTLQVNEYANHLVKLRNYLQLAQGNEIQQGALANQQVELQRAIDWLVGVEKKAVEDNSRARSQEEEEKKRKEEEMIKRKKFHWRRESKSWVDDWIATEKGKYETNCIKDTIEKADALTSFAHYKIHFPPTIWSQLTNEKQDLAKQKGYNEVKLDEKTKSFKWNKKIEDWYDKVSYDPIRGEQDPITGKDNNALFYGTEGTGKTSIVRKLTYETNCYPMIEIKGSSLSPNKLDSDIGVDALGKFIFTLCDIEHTLEDDFDFQREINGEVRYILFVDEADLVSKDSRLGEYTYLVFLKECMEQISKEKQSQNLWIFATNHIEMIARPVYRPGRLSNPLDFSWTLGDFMDHARDERITSQFPQHWQETDTLNDEDNKWVNRFNAMNFKDEFLPFWKKFIINSETKKKLPEIKKDYATKENPEQPGIQLGEFFEFFWNLKDSGQLPNFEGKWVPPRKPKLEESVPKIAEATDVRLNEIYTQIKELKEEIKIKNQDSNNLINLGVKTIADMLAEIGKKI